MRIAGGLIFLVALALAFFVLRELRAPISGADAITYLTVWSVVGVIALLICVIAAIFFVGGSITAELRRHRNDD